MPRVFRLYVGSDEREAIAKRTAIYFDGATLTRGRGLWKGAVEDCTIVEIVEDGEDRQEAVAHLAERLAFDLGQECVMVTVSVLESVAFVAAIPVAA